VAARRGADLDAARAAGRRARHAAGAHPSLGIGPLLETHEHDIGTILRESMEHEQASLSLYKDLLKAVTGESILLEEYARKMIAAEEEHLGEVDKMLRTPGDIEAFAGRKVAKKVKA
jgi:bacterioferritin